MAQSRCYSVKVRGPFGDEPQDGGPVTPTVSRYMIVSKIATARDHVELILDAPALSRSIPGQFVHVRTPGTLRRPISFSRLMPDTGQAGLLLQVVGAGTRWLAHQPVGGFLDVLGPLGRGFPPPIADRAWCLVGGGVGIPPLYAALQAWKDRMTAPIEVILGARTADFVIMRDEFQNVVDHPLRLTTDDGTLGVRGNVLGPLARWRQDYPDGQVYACGPTPMLAGVAHLMPESISVYLALEQRMGCGVGACLACVVPAHGEKGPEWRRVCHDGPVFSAEELIW